MHYIYVLMGKSCSGKNSVAENLLGRSDLNLRRVVTYTTRPKRAGEKDGREYHFVTRNFYSAQAAAGTVIDYREYKTVDGFWYYFTADDGQIDLAEHDSLIIGTPGIVKNLQNYYGKECVVPILLMVSDGELLRRALGRESRQFHGNYAEMCRRFLADKKDFSDETIKSLGHVYTVENNVLTHCSAEIGKIIMDNQNTGQTKGVRFEMYVPAIRYGTINVPVDADIDEEYIRQRWDCVKIDDDLTDFDFDRSTIVLAES